MIFFKSNSIDYCFIHIPKTAGTSFQNTILKNEIDNKRYNLLFNKYMEKFNCRYDHTPLSFIKNNFLGSFNLEKKITYLTIVRNPWERMASLFEQILLRDKVGLNKILNNNEIKNTYNKNYADITNNLLNDLGFYNSNKVKSFFKFWLFYLGYNIKILPNLNPNFNILPQSWWFFDELKNEEVNKFFLFEDLEILENMFNIKLSHDNKKKINFNYKNYYDQESIDYVFNLDRSIINKFNYDF